MLRKKWAHPGWRRGGPCSEHEGTCSQMAQSLRSTNAPDKNAVAAASAPMPPLNDTSRGQPSLRKRTRGAGIRSLCKRLVDINDTAPGRLRSSRVARTVSSRSNISPGVLAATAMPGVLRASANSGPQPEGCACCVHQIRLRRGVRKPQPWPGIRSVASSSRSRESHSPRTLQQSTLPGENTSAAYRATPTPLQTVARHTRCAPKRMWSGRTVSRCRVE